MDTGLVTAELLGVSAESVLYGLYLVLFPFAAYVLLTKKNNRHDTGRSRLVLLAGGVLLFCLVSANWLLDQVRLYDAFIIDGNKFGGALRLFGLLRDYRNVMRIVMYVFQVITVDLLLLYRLYIVWDGDWRILVLPACGLIGTVVTGTFEWIGFARATPYESIWLLGVSKYIIAGFSCNFTTNLLAVFFISSRILYLNNQVRSFGAAGLSSAVIILVESAGIYCIFNMMIMISVVLKSSFAFAIFYAASPITGISFCLITLRVGLSEWIDRVTRSSATSSASVSRRSGLDDRAVPLVVRVRREQAAFAESSECANGYTYKEEAPGTPIMSDGTLSFMSTNRLNNVGHHVA